MLNEFKIDSFETFHLKNVNSKIDNKIEFLKRIKDTKKTKKTFWTKIKNIFKG